LFTPSKPSLEFHPELANVSPAEQKPCVLSLPAEEPAEEVEDVSQKCAQLVQAVTTSGAMILQTDRELHKFGHHPGHVLVSAAVNASMAQIKALETSLSNRTGLMGQTSLSTGANNMSATVQAALQQAHGLDHAIAAVPIIKLQKVLGVPEIPGSTPDQEYDLNAVTVRPGPMGADELTST
jgi:hypothetical protein